MLPDGLHELGVSGQGMDLGGVPAVVPVLTVGTGPAPAGQPDRGPARHPGGPRAQQWPEQPDLYHNSVLSREIKWSKPASRASCRRDSGFYPTQTKVLKKKIHLCNKFDIKVLKLIQIYTDN